MRNSGRLPYLAILGMEYRYGAGWILVGYGCGVRASLLDTRAELKWGVLCPYAEPRTRQSDELAYC